VIVLHRLGRRFAALGALLALAGCSSPLPPNARELEGTVYVYVGTSSDQLSNPRGDSHVRNLFSRFIHGFLLLHPRVGVQLVFFPEAQIPAEVAYRHRSGLGPDLILVNGSTAQMLHRRGLSRTVSLPEEISSQLAPSLLRSFRTTGGLSALPVFSQPQVACFDRKVLPQEPTTLKELLEVSAKGAPVGLSLEPVDLFWSAGSLGGTAALQHLLKLDPERPSRPLTPAEREGLLRWLQWLDQAGDQQRINFYATTDELLTGLVKGDLAWIACRSRHLARLKNLMGSRLGVAPLPSGPSGAASPIARLRVWSFGIDSSPEQRRISQALAEFSVNPLVQRATTLSSLETLPVNRYVNIPVTSSRLLAALQAGMAQSEAYNLFNASLLEGESGETIVRKVLATMLFGATDETQASEMLVQRLTKLR
jgi:hypothetical protein